MAKDLSNKYTWKLLHSAEKSTTDLIKTASKRAIQNTKEATGDLFGNEVADKITKASQNNSKTDENELQMPKERYISPEKRWTDELRLG